jgi:hypothetical protein
MLKNKSVRRRDHLYGTAREIHYIDRLGAHKPTDAQTNLEELSAEDLRVATNRISMESKRANWARARGLAPTQPLRTKADWLRAYINTSALRREWGSVDQAEVVEYATALLAKSPGQSVLPTIK